MRPDLGKPPGNSEITPEANYRGRREFIKNSLLLAATATGVGASLIGLMGRGRRGLPAETAAVPSSPASLPRIVTARSPYSAAEPQTSYLDATTYNNFYEFGTDKSDPARNAHTLRPRPWT